MITCSYLSYSACDKPKYIFLLGNNMALGFIWRIKELFVFSLANVLCK